MLTKTFSKIDHEKGTKLEETKYAMKEITSNKAVI